MVDTSARDLGGTQRSLRQAIDQLDAAAPPPAPPRARRGSREEPPSMSIRISGPWLVVVVLAATLLALWPLVA